MQFLFKQISPYLDVSLPQDEETIKHQVQRDKDTISTTDEELTPSESINPPSTPPPPYSIT